MINADDAEQAEGVYPVVTTQLQYVQLTPCVLAVYSVSKSFSASEWHSSVTFRLEHVHALTLDLYSNNCIAVN